MGFSYCIVLLTDESGGETGLYLSSAFALKEIILTKTGNDYVHLGFHSRGKINIYNSTDATRGVCVKVIPLSNY